MKKICAVLLILFAWISVKAQNPVIITQPYLFQKTVTIGSLNAPRIVFAPGTINLNNSSASMYFGANGNELAFYKHGDTSQRAWRWDIGDTSSTFMGNHFLIKNAVKLSTVDSIYGKAPNGEFALVPFSGGGGTVTSVSGTANRITSTGGATPIIDISPTFEALLEKIANKATSFSTLNNTLYPTTQAVANYVATNSTNIYNANGTLTGDRTLTANGHQFFLTGTDGNRRWQIISQAINGSSATVIIRGTNTTGSGRGGSVSIADYSTRFSYLKGTSESYLQSDSTGNYFSDQIANIGAFYAADYGTGQRLHPNAIPSVKTTIALIDSVKGTISSGGITALTGDVTASGSGSVVATIKTNVGLAGSPTTTTQTTSDNSTKIATTAYVQANFTATAINFAPGTFTGSGTSGSPFALGIDASPTSGSGLPVTSGGVFTSLGLKAPLASPGLTGTPTAPTATVGTNTTQIATTAFVLANSGGGLSASNFVFNEVPSGTKNGTNVTFTLANTPTTGKVSAFKNGQLLTPTTDYSMSSGTCTYVIAPLSTDTLLFNYMK